MRTLVLAVLIIVVAAAQFATLPPSLEMARLISLLVLGTWVAAEAWVAHSRQRAAAAGIAQVAEREAQSRKEHDARILALKAEASRLRADLAISQAAVGKANAGAKARGRAGDVEVIGFLSLLQQKGRFLDFIMDDVTKYPDAQIGAAARVVHQGCAGVVREYFEIKPVHDGEEGATLTLPKDYDAHRYRLLGRVTGEPPLRGRVLHRGWLTTGVRLPERIVPPAPAGSPVAAADWTGGGIIAPAEVELS